MDKEDITPPNHSTERYILHDFTAGTPILIDREAKTLTLYYCNLHGQIYNLHNAEQFHVTNAVVGSLIQRSSNRNYFRYSKARDAYIYKYLLTPEQRELCGQHLAIMSSDQIIAASDSYPDAITAMCEWACRQRAFERTEKSHAELTQYCRDYLRDHPEPPTKPPKTQQRSHSR